MWTREKVLRLLWSAGSQGGVGEFIPGGPIKETIVSILNICELSYNNFYKWSSIDFGLPGVYL